MTVLGMQLLLLVVFSNLRPGHLLYRIYLGQAFELEKTQAC